MFKRVWSPKKVPTISKSIRVPDAMWKELEKLATESGETPNGFIVLVLDQFLQAQAETSPMSQSDLEEDKPA